MVRFGANQIVNPNIRSSMLARLFLLVFGNFETTTSYLHFMKTVNKIPITEGFKVLDAGCGKGRFSFWFAQKHPGVSIDACDNSTEDIGFCCKAEGLLRTGCNFFVRDLLLFEKENHYDFIFSNHVLEHIPENEKVIHNLVRSLRAGGYIYIQIPNASETRVINDKFLRFHSEWSRAEHIGQSFTLDSLGSLLNRFGCEILIKKYTEGFLGELSFELREMALHYFNSRLLFAALFPLLKLFTYIDFFISHHKGNGILIFARKIRDDIEGKNGKENISNCAGL